MMLPLLLIALLSPQDDFRLSADVTRVVLPLTVTDDRGRIVKGLPESAFTVYEDGKPQRIRFFSGQDIPITVGLIVDNSSSMKPRRAAANVAALQFVRLSHPEDEVFVTNFNHKVSFGLRDGVSFTGDVGLLQAALSDEPAWGKTALYDAILAALDHLGRGSRDRKALVVISDGGDTASTHGFDDVMREARASNAIIYTVLISVKYERDPEQRPDLMRKLARTTGGRFYELSDVQQIFVATREIAQELRSQYVIAYAPENARPDGGWRRIRVEAQPREGGRLSVRTREGYAPPPAARGAQ